MLLLGGCASTKLTIPEYIPVYVEAKPSKLLQIPYPIVLLHGLGQKASVWDKHAIKFYEKDLGLKHAGILNSPYNSVIPPIQLKDGPKNWSNALHL